MLGSRGIWNNGWKAVTAHPTVSGWGNFTEEEWELFHTNVDPCEFHDLAAQHPEKVREMMNLWYVEAGDNDVAAGRPLTVEILTRPAPDRQTTLPLHVLPEARRGSRVAGVDIRDRSYMIGAVVDIPAAERAGVLFAQGARFGGHALYMKDNRLHYVNNLVGMFEQIIVGTEDVPPARTHPVGLVRQGRR